MSPRTVRGVAGGGGPRAPQRVMETQTPGGAQHLWPPMGAPLPSWPGDPAAEVGSLCHELGLSAARPAASLPVPTQREPTGALPWQGCRYTGFR